MKGRAGPWVLALVALVALSCSGGGSDDAAVEPATTTTTAPITIDPCSLLSDDAVAGLAPELETGTADAVAGEHTCAWRNSNGIAVVNLRLARVATATLDEELARSALGGDEFVAVDGVGEEGIAVFRGRQSTGRARHLVAVYGRAGDLVVVLGTPGLDLTKTDPAFQTAVDLTTTALEGSPQ